MLTTQPSSVAMLDRMAERMWELLLRNLGGITEQEAYWRPHNDANNIRWIVGHLAWFEEWAHDALAGEGRYLTDRDPSAFLQGTIGELITRLSAARTRFRARVENLDEDDLSRMLSYFGRYDVSVLELLETHALHFTGHRFQIRYIRGTYSRVHGTRKSEFDPW